jgi:hypothetical protein
MHPQPYPPPYFKKRRKCNLSLSLLVILKFKVLSVGVFNYFEIPIDAYDDYFRKPFFTSQTLQLFLNTVNQTDLSKQTTKFF